MTWSDFRLLTIPSPLRMGGTCHRWRYFHCDYVIKVILKGIFSVYFELIKRDDSGGPDLITGTFKGSDFSQADGRREVRKISSTEDNGVPLKMKRWPSKSSAWSPAGSQQGNRDAYPIIMRNWNLPSVQMSTETDNSPESPDKNSAQPTRWFGSCENRSRESI